MLCLLNLYFKKYKYQYNNLNLNIICSLFKGLNPSFFEDTYKEIKKFYSNDYCADIDKYIKQLLKSNENNEKNELNIINFNKIENLFIFDEKEDIYKINGDIQIKEMKKQDEINIKS